MQETSQPVPTGPVNDMDDENTEQSGQVLMMPDVRELDENFETAFQLAMNKGPLCAEPVIGMAYFLEEVKINEELEVEAGELFPLACWL